MIKEFIKRYMIRSAIVSGLYFLGNDFNLSSSLSSKDTLNNYKNYNSEKINKKNLEEITKRNLLFYSEKDKTEYKIGPNLSFYKPK